MCLEAYSQNETNYDVILTIGNETVAKQEFIDLYQKNNPAPNKTIDKQDLKEYLDLFINYKLKLRQAKDLGLDTNRTLIDEIEQYRKQVTAPYINDAAITEQLINEAYDRLKYLVRASHILINIPANATPADTLAAYNKALGIRKQLLKGDDFASLAEEKSDDPSAKENKGDLGYFTSMAMIYPFEQACYTMNIGEVSMPIRTTFGFHIIKLIDHKPATFYTADVAHIWIDPKEHDNAANSKKIAEEAYSKLQSGNSFEEVAKMYSDDVRSKDNGGLLKGIKLNNVPMEYILQMQNLGLGTYSQPFESSFGWHIIKPISYNPLPPLNELSKTIKNRISGDVRSYRTIESFAQKTKDAYGFSEDITKLKAIEAIVTDSVFLATWIIPEDFNQRQEIFQIGDYSFTQYDLAQYIEKNQQKETPMYIPAFVFKAYQSATLDAIVNYGDQQLESRYPELKAQMDEFHNGVLIFAITDQYVWNRSVSDTIGLEQFYNKESKKYMWGKRSNATIWSFDTNVNADKAIKIVDKGTKKKWTNFKIQEEIAKQCKIDTNIERSIRFIWNKFEMGDNKMVDKSNQQVGRYVINEGNKRYIVVVHSIEDPEAKSLPECKGIVTSDYQDFLERQWILELRNKYPYKVNEQVFDSIK